MKSRLVLCLFILCFLCIFSLAKPQDEEKAYCKVKSYNKNSGLLRCADGTVFFPEEKVKKDLSLKKEDNLVVKYTERANKKFWYSLTVEVKVFK